MSADGLRSGDALLQRDTKTNVKRLADGLSLPHHIRGESARRCEFADIFQCRVCQRADRIEARIAPEFRPYFGAHVANDRRLESGLPESSRDATNSFAFRSVDLGERETVALDVTDNAGAHNLRRGISDAGDHAVDQQIIRDNPAWIDTFQADALMGTSMLEEIPPGNSILRSEHCGLRTHDRSKVPHYRGDLMCLHAEDDQVLLADAGDTITRRDARDDLLAFF